MMMLPVLNICLVVHYFLNFCIYFLSCINAENALVGFFIYSRSQEVEVHVILLLHKSSKAEF